MENQIDAWDLLSPQDQQTLSIVATTSVFSIGKQNGLFTDLPETTPDLTEDRLNALRAIAFSVAVSMQHHPLESVHTVRSEDGATVETRIGTHG